MSSKKVTAAVMVCVSVETLCALLFLGAMLAFFAFMGYVGWLYHSYQWTHGLTKWLEVLVTVLGVMIGSILIHKIVVCMIATVKYFLDTYRNTVSRFSR